MSLRTMYERRSIWRVKIIDEVVLSGEVKTVTLMSWTDFSKLTVGPGRAQRLVKRADLYLLEEGPLTKEKLDRVSENYLEMYVTYNVPSLADLFWETFKDIDPECELGVYGKGTRRTIRKLLGEWGKEKES